MHVVPQASTADDPAVAAGSTLSSRSKAAIEADIRKVKETIDKANTDIIGLQKEIADANSKGDNATDTVIKRKWVAAAQSLITERGELRKTMNKLLDMEKELRDELRQLSVNSAHPGAYSP